VQSGASSSVLAHPLVSSGFQEAQGSVCGDDAGPFTALWSVCRTLLVTDTPGSPVLTVALQAFPVRYRGIDQSVISAAALVSWAALLVTFFMI
jgi:hypothetical protein